jgi:hypothetical protein
MAEFEKDPAFVERRRRRAEDLRRAQEADARDEAPLVEDLRRMGVPLDSVWELVNSTNTFAQSLPILLDHLQRPYPDAIREGIARAMAVPTARFAWPVLLRLYKQENGARTKHGIAVALSNIADDEMLDDVLALAGDVRHGDSRVLLLGALERSHLPRAHRALMDLGGDPELHKEVQRILHRQKRTRQRRG